MIHTKTCKRELVDDLYELGLSISYNHVLDISTELGNKIVLITECREVFVHLLSRVAILQLVQLTTSIMTPALLVRMAHFMELGYPYFSIHLQTPTVAKFLGLFSSCPMIWLLTGH